jgi:hypothetical protein
VASARCSPCGDPPVLQEEIVVLAHGLQEKLMMRPAYRAYIAQWPEGKASTP